MKLLISVPENKIEELVDFAVSRGYMRENPRSKWKVKERREACKFAIEHWVYSYGRPSK